MLFAAPEVGQFRGAGGRMLKRLLFTGLLVVVAGFTLSAGRRVDPAAGAAAGRLLTGQYSREFILERVRQQKTWVPFPPASDRASWDGQVATALGASRRDLLVKEAARLVGEPWPALPATSYMEFARNGNRSRFEAAYFERRRRLATLVLAECFEHRGRFLDEIANGLWAITEEATWCVPAHATRAQGDVLHRQDVLSVDLFAAETAMTLSTARYLLEAELTRLSPALTDRVRREVLRRVIEPVESGKFGSDWWQDGRNNWAPWCASNVLGSAMLAIDDPARLAAVAWRMMEVADRFVDRYGEDGGCDEGPSYWNEAGGALLVLLELLHSRTGGAVDVYGEPKIAAMGAFIANAHVAGPWFLNFSDADARTTPHPGKVYRFGERVHLPALQDLALLAQREWNAEGTTSPALQMSGVSRALLGPLMEMFWIPSGARPGGSRLPASVWLADIQTLIARESGESPYTGLFLAARGGHNDESHNHNDVGNVVVFLDGQPGIVDVGRETYTAQTFGPARYDLWFTRGSAHNAPVVNGVEQQAGRQFEATAVTVTAANGIDRLGMNLDKAYPAAARLRSLRREVEMVRAPSPEARIRDTWALEGRQGVLRYTFYSPGRSEEAGPGVVTIDCGARKLVLEVKAQAATVSIETVTMADPIMRANWGGQLYRIVVDVKAPAAGTCAFAIHAHP
jgi:hypothetical protein